MITVDQTWSQFNPEIGIDGQFQFRNWLFKKKAIGIDNSELELKCHKNFFFFTFKT